MSAPSVEMWTYGHAKPRGFARQAQHAEEDGWTGITAGESQNLTGDPFVELGIAATVTTRIKLGTSVAITATRHPATTATAIATVQHESLGRAVLGIGTGDSATAHLGLRPAPVKVFARYLERLQGYLAGEDVPFDVEADGQGQIGGVDAIGLASGPQTSRLRWLDPTVPKVTVDVAATGPKTIAAAAKVGDRVGLAVGVSPERVRWGIETARNARVEAGLDPDVLPIGMYLPMFVHPDRHRARDLISGLVASYVHMSSRFGKVVGPANEREKQVLLAVRNSYDMEAHHTYGSPQSKHLTDDVVDAFAIAGPGSYCVERLQELVELGISKFVFVGYTFDLDPDEAKASRRRIVEEVLPAFR